MIKKKFFPVRSSASSSNLSKPAQPSKSKQTLPLEKKPSDSSLENIYRLPSSLKRTEDMINNSILQRQISSKILDIVGSTFRVKNANPNQGQYFCSPTNFTQFLKYKEYASSEFLDTLYEVEGEESSEASLQTETTHEISTLSIGIEQTRRTEDVSSSILSKTSHGSFLQALDKITNQSTLITTQEKRSYSSLLLDDPKSARVSSSTSRSNRRDSDPWKQIKQAIASKKMTYSLENVSKQKKVETSNMKNIKKDKKELPVSTIQRELERDVKRLENRVKRLREKENLLIKNKINGKTKQDSNVCQEEAEKEDILNVKIKEEQASLEGHKLLGNKKSIQEDIAADISNGSKESTIKIQPSKNLINLTANHEIPRKSFGSYQIKNQLLEPRRRTELDIKTKTLGNRKE